MTEILATTLKILFICLGGICRAPAAVGTMNFLIEKYNLTGIEVASCGTEGYHPNELPDERMRNAGLERGIQMNSRAKVLSKEDFEKYDLVITMDEKVYEDVRFYAGNHLPKIKKIINFITDKKGLTEVPDPFYGTQDDFRMVLDLLYDGCIGLLKEYKYIENE